MRRTGVIIGIVLAVVVAAGVVWWRSGGPGPGENAERFLEAWRRGDTAAMREVTAGPPADFDALVARSREGLGVTEQVFQLRDVSSPKNGRAQGGFHASLTLAGGGKWSYDGRMSLVERDGRWLVEWSPTVIHPDLRDGQRLTASRAWPARAEITAADGSSLSGSSSGSVQQLTGVVGPASKESAAKLGAPYRPGDPAGTEGLQQQYEKRLVGTPALAVQIVDAAGKPVKTLQRFGGAPGKTLKTTLDPAVQRAAGLALAGVNKPASLVALRPSTGEILAVANKPGGYNRALMGQYPPGSTFKVVTAAALVADGLDAKSAVPCPATTNVGGRTFKNYKYEDFGTVPLKDAFAHSCNTTFARLAVDRLGHERLTQVAEQFGFNKPIIGGLPAVRAAFPEAKDATAFAAASFGQGEVLTSPLNMAGVAAAAAGGTWRSPRLVSAELASQALDAGGRAPQPPHKLEPAVRSALQRLMPAVVTEGTASDVRFPTGTAGKTGTAEFGSGAEPPTHAWFIGYRGDLAFAVIVEGGGTGAQAAAPLAARFLASTGL